MSRSGLVLGIDVGTSETKGVAVTLDGVVVAQGAHPHRVRSPRPGFVEHDAEHDWWGGLTDVVATLLAHPDVDPTAVRAMTCSGIGPCVLPVAADGRPLRPAILYGVDTRAAAEIATMTARQGEETIRAVCGNDLTSQSAGPKIAWVAGHEPQIARRTRWYLTCQSWLVLRLTGEVVVDRTSASYVHPFYDLHAHRWVVDGWEDVVREDQLPRVLGADEVAGSLRPEVAAELGLPASVVVGVGTADAVAEALGSGVEDESSVMCMYGSSGFVIAPTAAPRPAPGLYCAPGIAAGTSLLAGGTSTAGTFLGWVAELLGLCTVGRADHAAMGRLAATAAPGAGGVLALPHLSGERTPFDEPAARAAFLGLGLEHGRADLARAAVEGVATSMALALEHVLGAAGQDPRRVVAVGGGTRSRLWLQSVSDLTGLAQHLVRPAVGAALGDAVLAARSLGLTTRETTGWVRAVDVVEPGSGSPLADLAQRHRTAVAALRPTRTDRGHP